MALGLSASLLGCGGDEPVVVPEPASDRVTTIDSAQGQALIESGEALVVDVRSRGVYVAGHLVGAQHIAVDDDELWASRIASLDPQRPTIVYGGSGEQSSAAAAMLLAEGFSAIYDLGGVQDWDPDQLQLES